MEVTSGGYLPSPLLVITNKPYFILELHYVSKKEAKTVLKTDTKLHEVHLDNNCFSLNVSDEDNKNLKKQTFALSRLDVFTSPLRAGT